jgi:hypothetical protein
MQPRAPYPGARTAMRGYTHRNGIPIELKLLIGPVKWFIMLHTKTKSRATHREKAKKMA